MRIYRYLIRFAPRNWESGTGANSAATDSLADDRRSPLQSESSVTIDTLLGSRNSQSETTTSGFWILHEYIPFKAISLTVQTLVVNYKIYPLFFRLIMLHTCETAMATIISVVQTNTCIWAATWALCREKTQPRGVETCYTTIIRVSVSSYATRSTRI